MAALNNLPQSMPPTSFDPLDSSCPDSRSQKPPSRDKPQELAQESVEMRTV